MSSIEDRDCEEQCRSEVHGELICAALTKRAVSDIDLCAYLQHLCTACDTVKDPLGRTALHLAASCGRVDVVKWLLRMKRANINAKDYESGYTPLHRSVFYGKVDVSVYLIKMGANMTLTDFNGLTSLEHAMLDCLQLDSPSIKVEAGEAYVWGSNTNYTLGPQEARTVPELLDAYHRMYPEFYVRQICLEEFHCILVTMEGRVFSCGHGQGGRLGLANEKTVLAPQKVRFHCSGHKEPLVACVKASIAVDHSVFLTDAGNIWTCGLNTHRVLGLQPPPAQVLVPTPIPFIQDRIENVCAARFHTVAWGCNSIYTWGLHGGQLGHDKTNERYVISPKLVTFLHNLGSKIVDVAVSNEAIAVVTSKRDIYVLHEYQCRKIGSKLLDIISVKVVGGKLNDKIDECLSTEENHELVVVGLTKVGKLYIWKESDPTFVRCIFSINRSLEIRQVTLNLNEILFVTNQGEAYQSILKPRKRKTIDNNVQTRKNFHEFLEKDNCHHLKVTKIPRTYRALSIHSDLKGRNYAILQKSPKAHLKRPPLTSHSSLEEDMRSLLEEASEDDQIHDVVFKVSNRLFRVHRFVLALSSSVLSDLATNANEDKIIELTNVNEDIFEQLLLFIYTGTCDLLKVGECADKFRLLSDKSNKKESNLKDELKNIDDLENISAFQCYKNEKCKSKSTNSSDNARDAVRMLHEASKKFAVGKLQDILDNVYYYNGVILTKKDARMLVNHEFDKKKFPDLHDLVIKTKDGREIAVHKCVLASRLEYFRNLFSLRWNANCPTKEISLPFPFLAICQLIDFLYTDRMLIRNEELDALCNLLILSDQLFALKLKEICESLLCKHVNFKNVVQIFSFASVYNTKQLRVYCMEFICANLAPMLELKSLEMIDDNLLHDLTSFYCDYNLRMQQRIITPYSYAPSDETVLAAKTIHNVVIDDSESENDIKTTPKPQKKRSRARKNTDSGTRKEVLTANTAVIDNYDNEVKPVNEQTKVTEKAGEAIETTLNEPTNENHSNVVQTRLKAIAFAQNKTDCDTIVTDYIKLPLRPNTIDVTCDEFPELSSHHLPTSYSKSPTSKEKVDVKHKITKLSQKQRKRLSSESSFGVLEPSSPKLAESPKNPWKICTEITNVSPIGSPIVVNTMDSIITDEKRQKENFVKMKTKLLVHTQMEDKAIEDLYRFYNVGNVFDEIVNISRVEKGLVASPVWVPSSKIK